MMKTQRAKRMQYLYTCILMVFLLILSSSSWAQKKTIQGIVTDETNEPVIGANVVIKNTSIGTITGIDGQYRIEAPANATLVFTFVGYNPIEEKVNGRTQINVSMKSNDITLNDVVVVGYGVQKKVSLTGAIAGVRSTELLKLKTRIRRICLLVKYPEYVYGRKVPNPVLIATTSIFVDMTLHWLSLMVFPVMCKISSV